MKKSTKLLSVLLTVFMIFSSISVGAFAAKTSYQTVQNLESLNAYSPYGTVTRLSEEERMSILMDSLDLLLAPLNSLNMGTVLDLLGLKVTINLTSVNGICASLDSFQSTKSAFMYKLAAAIVNLGIVEDLSFSNWQSGMTREGTAQMTIVNQLLKLLSDNASVIGGIFDNGIQLGLIANFISGLDLDPINNLVKDLPKMINTIVLPLFSRQDDNAAQRNTLGNSGSNLMTVAQSFINGIFNKPMSWTSYRVDAQGNDLGFTTALPMGAAAGTSRYFVAGTKNGKATLTQWDYKYAGVLGGDPAGYYETVTYTLSDEEEYVGSGTYLYKAPDDYEGDHTLKWYKAEGKVDNNGNVQSGYWLPSVAGKVGTDITLNINGNDSVAGLLYKWAPVVFAELAPTVANGSLKKVIAGAFDVKFTKIGVKGDDMVAAAAAATGNPDNFFTKDQPYYTWEYSDYKVIDGTPYYRFQDEYFVGEIPSNISTFYNMINWDYTISPDFMNKYIPSAPGATSAAGYTRVLEALNDFVYDLIQEFIAPSWECKGVTVNRADIFQWTAGSNANLIENVKKSARNLFMLAPEEIVDEYYDQAQFYDAMMNGTTAQAVNGLICAAVNLLMPQIKFADNIVDQPMLAIAAAVVRELCTQLMPTYNFDAMIFSDYNNRTMLANKSSDYWLDTVLYMGVNLGMYYLRNLADLGEDDATNGYFGAMKNLGALPTQKSGTEPGDAYTFGANAQYVSGTASWLYMVDWVIDWALSSEVEWAWQFEKIIDCGSTVKLSTYQNPFNKLDTILFSKLLPAVKDLLVVDSSFSGTTYGSNTYLEKILKGGVVDSITSLDLVKLVKVFAVSTSGVFCKNNIADELVKIIVNLLNNVLYKVAGNANIITGITSVNTLLNHANLKSVVQTLVSKLGAASGTYHVLQPILPLANFFIGWTVDPQKYADPQIYFTNDKYDTYAKNGETSNKIKFVNTSSGMLLKHRNSKTPDTAYTIRVTGVSSSGGVTAKTQTATVEPGQTGEIGLNVPSSGNGVTKLTVTYQYTGKDGSALGGPQTKDMYIYYTQTADQEDEWEAAVDTGDYATREAYRKIEFTQNLYGSITEYTGAMSYKAATIQIGNKTKKFVSCGVLDTAFDTRATQFFQPITNREEAGWLTKLEKENNDYASSVGKLYKVKSASTTAATFNKENSVANNYYGIWNMGQVATKYGNKSGTWHVQFVYYNDFEIGKVKDKYVGMSLTKADFPAAASAAFDAYDAALKDVVKYADFEKTTNYVTDVQVHIEKAIATLDAAYEALIAFGKIQHNGDVAQVKATLDSLETDENRDINFQDYLLFEYFKYENQRTSAREMIKTTTPPAAPESYIEGSVWGNDLIAAIVADQTNNNVKTGINATVVEPSDEDMANWQIAKNDFVPTTYSELAVDDQNAKLQYYYNFMTAVPKTIDKTFLQKEIAYAQAQNFEAKHAADPYSTDTWSRYVTALAKAQEVYADGNALESEVFDAKYELMVAANTLLLKSHSMKDSGYLDRELNTVIAQAENILEYYGVHYKLAEGVTADAAFAQLVEALGIRYDVTVDSVDYDGILYDRSAVTFVDYDRVNSVKNMRATDAAADKLRAAIANFVVDVKIESSDEENVKEIDQEVQFIQGITPGSINTLQELLDKVHCTESDVVLEGATNSENMFGTGATVTVKINDVAVIKYFVVIYGDVNGDGAVDGFDTLEVNKHDNRLTTLLNIYETAGDVNDDGIVDSDDYAQIKLAAAGYDTVDQVKNVA